MEFKTYDDILKFAIRREEEAIEAYGEMSEKAQTPGLKHLLLELQDEEKKHKKLLQNISEEQVASFPKKEVLDLKISDFLTEEPITGDMTFQDLLIFAAKKEQHAVELYTRLKEDAQNEELQKIFDFLISQEKTHKLKLEKEYEKQVLQED
ncbi:MAG: ferritin family protein [Candidatus Aminicenantales bacterium]